MDERQRSSVFCCFKTKMYVTDVPKGKDTNTNSASKQGIVKPLAKSETKEVQPIVLSNSETVKTTSMPVTEEPKPSLLSQKQEVKPAAIPIIEETETVESSVITSTEQLNGTIDIEEVQVNVTSVIEESTPSSVFHSEEVEPVAVPIIEDTKPSLVEEAVESSVTVSTEQMNGSIDIEEVQVSVTSLTEEPKPSSEIVESSVTVSTEEINVTTFTETSLVEEVTNTIPNGEAQEDALEYVGDGTDLITEALFADILEKQFGKHTIKYFNVKKSGGGGENYMSWMFYVSIDFEKEDGSEEYSSYIVKLMPPNDPQAAFKKGIRAFLKEVEMYEQIVPKMEEILLENGIDVQLVPKCWKSTSEPYEILIFEDLKAHKYENVNRLEGMDLQHAEMVLEKLAKFHAASACLFEKSGPFSDQIMSNMLNKEIEPMLRAMQSMLWPKICKSMRQWNTCQEYVDRMESMTDRSADLQVAAFQRDDDEFNVLLHGDLWTNNIMFQQDENGVAKDVIFVDLQVSRYGPPLQDLVYFILSSTHISIKIEKFDYLIGYYHNELVKNLNILNYPKPAPTLVDLHTSILKRIFYGIVVCTGIMAIALVPPREDATIDNFLEGEDSQFMMDTYMNPGFIKSCEIVLPFLENKGAFDL